MDNFDLDRDLKTFCRTITGTSPILIPYEPEWWAKPNECFQNVENKIFLRGGSAMMGWQFLRNPLGTSPTVISAIHHAVWRSKDGRLVDITPVDSRYLTKDDSIWFLPDRQATLKLLLGPTPSVSDPQSISHRPKIRRCWRQSMHSANLKKRPETSTSVTLLGTLDFKNCQFF